MDLREEFVLKAKAPGANISGLCREFGISRKTGHKWLARFETGGQQALSDLSRRPHQTLNGTDGELVLQIIEARHAHPRWGPKKLRVILMRKGVSDVPTVRTIARILMRAVSIGAAATASESERRDRAAIAGARGTQQRALDRGLQRLVADSRRQALRAADGSRRLQPVCVGRQDARVDEEKAGSGRFRAAFPAIWAAVSYTHLTLPTNREV